MAPRYNQLEMFIRRLRRSRFAFLYTGYLAGRGVYRAVVKRVTGAQLGWVAWLQSGRWVGPTSFEIMGWAYERGSGSNEVTPTVTVICHNPRTAQTISAVAELRYDSAVNARARLMPVDYANYAFTAVLDLTPVLAGEVGDSWEVRVKVADTRTVTGGFTNRMKTTAGTYLVARTSGDRQIEPVWSDAGLGFVLRQPAAIAESVSFDGEQVRIVVQAPQLAIAKAALVDGEHVPLAVEAAGDGRFRLTGVLPSLGRAGAADPSTGSGIVPTVAELVEAAYSDPSTGSGIVGGGAASSSFVGRVAPKTRIETPTETEKNNPEGEGDSLPVRDWTCTVWGADGTQASVASSLDERDAEPSGTLARYAYTGLDSVLTIRDTPAIFLVDDVELVEEPFGLRYTGRALGEVAGASMVLTGPRRDLDVELSVDGDRFTAFASLLISAWGGPELPPQAGTYVLRAHGADGAWLRVGSTSALLQRMPIRSMGRWLKLRVGIAAGGRVSSLLSKPLDDRLLGDYHQARLKAEYHSRTFQPREAVYFESFNGRSATCNTYALDREVARRFPEMKRYWGVLDYSIAVPEGAIPVLKGTLEWWDARFSCRYVIINEWIRQKFKHQPFQVVLQTWHGSMFKRIGLDRPNFSNDEKVWLGFEREKWDVLLSQNAHSSAIFRSAYAWEGPIWEEGYPRNDDLSTKSGEAIRELLGIRPDQKVILYAPTWREQNEDKLVDFLDLPEMARQLGDDYLILLRGHSRTLRTDDNVRVPGVLDVTSYPHVTDIFLAADAMITDYSSVMFDYSVTGRPMIFFVPDLAEYRDQTRGVYFDLEELAPGPVTFSQDEVMAAIRSMETDAPGYAEKYAAWQERFNAHDDGHAAERVIDRLFALPKK